MSKSSDANTDQMINSLRDTIVAMVRRDGPDLSARQLAVFLTCYLRGDGSHTVRGLAAELNVSKPAITRALDRLKALDLARRAPDPMDRRSVLIKHTIKGKAYLRDLCSIVNEAATQEKAAPVRKTTRTRRTEEQHRAG
ncbi:MarR family winged helix-turn-helix transcriptional regulator [Komagataeibacter europaeus]|uniref:MarR family winged helix-turn-helix transcriptional regulator n=1 Tax=Komagataeibacter europaeus TaxID=33995 RepID=UPI0003739AD5|nr:MarR family transcriptional regulator [Komagataeibacter europaeus]GBQ48237.1 MarR family transcriptional regulator [Komagataeibacter europaeus LMG 18890]